MQHNDSPNNMISKKELEEIMFHMWTQLKHQYGDKKTIDEKFGLEEQMLDVISISPEFQRDLWPIILEMNQSNEEKGNRAAELLVKHLEAEQKAKQEALQNAVIGSLQYIASVNSQEDQNFFKALQSAQNALKEMKFQNDLQTAFKTLNLPQGKQLPTDVQAAEGVKVLTMHLPALQKPEQEAMPAPKPARKESPQR